MLRKALVNARFRLIMLKYNLSHWAFQWKVDEEDDITLLIFGFIQLTKYKEHTIVKFSLEQLKNAPKYVGETA